MLTMNKCWSTFFQWYIKTLVTEWSSGLVVTAGKDIILKGLTDDDKTLKKLYGSYKKRAKNKGKIWSEYALSRNNTREYLAEGVSFYSSSISNRKTLKEKDHDLYEYIKKLLRKLQ